MMVTDTSRPLPAFDTLILRRLLRHITASLHVDPSSRDSTHSRTYEMTAMLAPGEPSVVNPTVTVSSEDAAVLGYPDIHIANEPSLEELLHFADTLRGKSVTLHSSSKGSFAHHLSSYLTAWGMDVSHMSTETDANGEYELVGEVSEPSAPPLPVLDLPSPSIAGPPSSTSPSSTRHTGSPAFILIDDDVGVLRNRLQKIRIEQAYPLHLQARKRPSLATHHRPRSSPQVARVMGLVNANSNPPPATSVVIVHFTSLAQFKMVKDVVQTILTPSQGSSLRIPEVIVIPKPAGPRRFLTALHTAVTRPVVDPFFIPTATSPMSPGLHSISPFFSLAGAPRSPGTRSSASIRTSSDRSARSPKDFLSETMAAHPPPSPLGQSDNMEYFSDAAVKLGTSPATGLLIQSPDGQPTGIFFHPKPRAGPVPPTPNMERDRDRATETPTRQRPNIRTSSGGDSGTIQASSFSVSPPVARPTTRPSNASSDPTDLIPVSLKGRGRHSSINEEKSSQSIEQNSVASGVVATDQSAQQTSPRLLTRRLSQHVKDGVTSPPASPQLGPANKPGTLRRTLKRPIVESYWSAPANVSKKGKAGPDSNIVPPISVLIVDGA